MFLTISTTHHPATRPGLPNAQALDCELLRWSAKELDLITDQYASAGAAARHVLPAALASLHAASGRGLDVTDLTGHRVVDLTSPTQRQEAVAWWE